ncbi:MAG TPA: hypothetical protein VGT03_02910 [Candidatus Acidoferrales bacterium]|nr:hypothetical protein [Candidatus Acidoferrales bacterium]
MSIVIVGVMVGPAPLGTLAPSSACVPLLEKSTISGKPSPLLEGTTEKSSVPETPPPGAGFTACTGNVPAVATSWFASCAETCVEPDAVVGRALPSINTWLAESIPVPVTIRLALAVPATMLLGLTEVTVGLGFTTFTNIVFDSPPPGGFPPGTGGFKIANCTVPAVMMSEDTSDTWSLIAPRKVIGRFEPFTTAMEVFTKFVPLTVIVPPPVPASTVVGEIERICGMGAVLGVIVNV